MAAKAEAEAEKLSVSMATLRHQAAELRKLADVTERSGLRPIGHKGTTGTREMEARPASRGSRVSAANTKGQWPFQQALQRRNLSVLMWAESATGVTVEAVRSWLKKPGKGGRPIPEVWAKRIEREFGEVDGKGAVVASEVPAVAASWPNGIRAGQKT